jgi:LuxR family transcriptional regulator, maltose regulon positive regulatory protein
MLTTLEPGIGGSEAATALDHLLRGETGNARRALEQVDAAPDDHGPDSPAEAIVPLVLAMAGTGGVERMAANGLAALSLASRPGPVRDACSLACGIAGYIAGDRGGAARRLNDALEGSARTPAMVKTLAQTLLALLDIDGGTWDLAQHRLAIAMRWCDEEESAGRCTALTWAAAGLVLGHLRIPDEARVHAGRAERALDPRDEDLRWLDVEARIVLARAYVRLHDATRARSLLDEASRAGRAARLGPHVLERIEQAWVELDEFASRSLAGAGSLTTAELRILRFLPSHLSFWEIGERLNVSGNTVKTQARATYNKLGASGRSEAVARAAALGLIEPVIV